MVEVGTGSKGDKEIRRYWPVEEGLTAGTTTQEFRDMALTPETQSIVSQRSRVGID